MKIAYLIHQFLPGFVGGTEVLTASLARRARAGNHEVVIVSMRAPAGAKRVGDGFSDADWEGLRVRVFGGSAVAPAEPWLAEYDDRRTAALVAAEVEQFRPEVVHVAHLEGATAAVLPRLKKLGAVVVVMFTDFWPLCHRQVLTFPDGGLCAEGPGNGEGCVGCAGLSPVDGADAVSTYRSKRAAEAVRGRWERIRQYLRESADALVTLSDFQTKILTRCGWEGPVRCFLHGPEPAPLREAREWRARDLPRREGPVRLLFAGTLIPQKGAQVILEALADCRRRDVSLTVMGFEGGDAAYVARLRELAARDGRVTWRSPVAPADFPGVLAGHDALVAPQLWYENGPLITKAALLAGLPVATHGFGSLGEGFDAATQGWVISPATRGAWKDWLDGLETGLARRVVEAGPDPATADTFGRQCVDLYESLLARKRSSPP